MYLQKFTIRGVKCFEEVSLEFPPSPSQTTDPPPRKCGDDPKEVRSYAGWHVLLGANATGKSTLLQAIGIALVGSNAWPQLLTPRGWVRRGSTGFGILQAVITKGDDDLADRYQRGPFQPEIAVLPDKSVKYSGVPYDTPQFVLGGSDKKQILKSVYATKKRGWFACGYGPFRRLSGGNNDVVAKLTNKRQWCMSSLFDESVALVRCEPWLLELHHKANDPDRAERGRYRAALDRLKEIINSLLPGQVCLHRVDSTGVYFVTRNGAPIALSELSDGYRSFLALVIDLLRHIFEDHEDSAVDQAGDPWKFSGGAVLVEGVVLVDEIDAHLHPTWQRRIGHMLRQVFPRIQFIVSTHSPFVAQAASTDGLFMLRADGTTSESASEDAVRVVQPEPSVRGWRAERILTSELFGMLDTIGVEAEKLLSRYQELAGQTAFKRLTADEATEMHALEGQLGRLITAPGESTDEFRLREESEAFIRRTLAEARHEAPKADSDFS